VKAANMSWNRAMDEVRADRLIEKHGKNSLLVIIHEWPQKKKYKDKPELIPSLEYLVRTLFLIGTEAKSWHTSIQDRA